MQLRETNFARNYGRRKLLVRYVSVDPLFPLDFSSLPAIPRPLLFEIKIENKIDGNTDFLKSFGQNFKLTMLTDASVVIIVKAIYPCFVILIFTIVCELGLPWV